jgi:hypothetical protein
MLITNPESIPVSKMDTIIKKEVLSKTSNKELIQEILASSGPEYYRIFALTLASNKNITIDQAIELLKNTDYDTALLQALLKNKSINKKKLVNHVFAYVKEKPLTSHKIYLLYNIAQNMPVKVYEVVKSIDESNVDLDLKSDLRKLKTRLYRNPVVVQSMSSEEIQNIISPPEQKLKQRQEQEEKQELNSYQKAILSNEGLFQAMQYLSVKTLTPEVIEVLAKNPFIPYHVAYEIMRLQKTTKQAHIALIENISQIIRRKRQQRENDYHDFYRILSEYTQMNNEDIQNEALKEINQLAEEEAEEIENNNQYHLHGVQIRDAFHY